MPYSEEYEYIYLSLNKLAYELDMRRERDGNSRGVSKLCVYNVKNEWLALLLMWCRGDVSDSVVKNCVATESVDSVLDLLVFTTKGSD